MIFAMLIRSWFLLLATPAAVGLFDDAMTPLLLLLPPISILMLTGAASC